MDIGDLDPDPLAQLRAWLDDARDTVPQPDAMVVATATPDGRPSARVVLLRGLDDRGLVFFTNRESRKGRELTGNPRAAAVLHWWELGRQVRVEGAVEEVSAGESDAYWETRPRGSRIAAWASPQSRPLVSREELEALVAEAHASFGDGDVPRPGVWGGFRIIPELVELWTHRDDRLHDRIVYRRAQGGWAQGGWERERLAP
jgi:pyridoxamine 5'-phosphate oxidase